MAQDGPNTHSQGSGNHAQGSLAVEPVDLVKEPGQTSKRVSPCEGEEKGARRAAVRGDAGASEIRCEPRSEDAPKEARLCFACALPCRCRKASGVARSPQNESQVAEAASFDRKCRSHFGKQRL